MDFDTIYHFFFLTGPAEWFSYPVFYVICVALFVVFRRLQRVLEWRRLNEEFNSLVDVMMNLEEQYNRASWVLRNMPRNHPNYEKATELFCEILNEVLKTRIAVMNILVISGDKRVIEKLRGDGLNLPIAADHALEINLHLQKKQQEESRIPENLEAAS